MDKDSQFNNIRNGLFFFQSSPCTISTVEVAKQLGEILKMPGMPITQTLSPKESDGLEKSNYSGNYGMGEFPLHTDLAHWYIPPRYFLLRCIVPAPEVTTNFVPAAEIFANERSNDLKRALFRPRRRLNGRLSLFNLHQDYLYRWDTLYLKPMTKTAKQLQARIDDKLKHAQQEKVSLSQRGDCILVDNWKMLHSRSKVPSTGNTRRIERVYISELKNDSNDS